MVRTGSSRRVGLAPGNLCRALSEYRRGGTSLAIPPSSFSRPFRVTPIPPSCHPNPPPLRLPLFRLCPQHPSGAPILHSTIVRGGDVKNLVILSEGAAVVEGPAG